MKHINAARFIDTVKDFYQICEKEHCSIVGYYTGSSCNSLPTFREKWSVLYSRWDW